MAKNNTILYEHVRECKDIYKDSANCGACGNTCPSIILVHRASIKKAHIMTQTINTPAPRLGASALPGPAAAHQSRRRAIDVLAADYVKTGELPAHFLCHITHDLMAHPVITPAGRHYDRSAIELWLARGNSLEPFDRSKTVRQSDLITNYDLMGEIDAFKSAVAALGGSILPAYALEQTDRAASGASRSPVAPHATATNGQPIGELPVARLQIEQLPTVPRAGGWRVAIMAHAVGAVTLAGVLAGLTWCGLWWPGLQTDRAASGASRSPVAPHATATNGQPIGGLQIGRLPTAPRAGGAWRITIGAHVVGAVTLAGVFAGLTWGIDHVVKHWAASASVSQNPALWAQAAQAKYQACYEGCDDCGDTNWAYDACQMTTPLHVAGSRLRRGEDLVFCRHRSLPVAVHAGLGRGHQGQRSGGRESP